MNNKKNILIISNDENSDAIKLISRLKFIPIIRRSILTAIKFLRHNEIAAIVIDKKNQNVDAIEFILNASEVVRNVKIFVPAQLYDIEDWNLVKIHGIINLYDELNYPLERELSKSFLQNE